MTLHLKALLLGDAGGEAKSCHTPAHPDPGGLDRHIFLNIALDLGGVHVASVGGVSRDAMVLLDDGVKHLSKVLVGVCIPCIDATMLVIKLNSTSNGLGEGEAAGGSLVLTQLGP